MNLETLRFWRSERKPQIKLRSRNLNREEMVTRGKNAGQLLESGIYHDARQRLEDELKEQWTRTMPSDSEQRERLYLMIQLMDDIGRVLLAWKGDAQMEISNAERKARELN